MIYKIKHFLLLKGDLCKTFKNVIFEENAYGASRIKRGKNWVITFSFLTKATTPMTQFTCAKKQVLNHPTLLCLSNCLGWQFYKESDGNN